MGEVGRQHLRSKGRNVQEQRMMNRCCPRRDVRTDGGVCQFTKKEVSGSLAEHPYSQWWDVRKQG